MAKAARKRPAHNADNENDTVVKTVKGKVSEADIEFIDHDAEDQGGECVIEHNDNTYNISYVPGGKKENNLVVDCLWYKVYKADAEGSLMIYHGTDLEEVVKKINE